MTRVLNSAMQRQPEPERMDLPDEVAAYANADFAEVNARFVDRLLELTHDRSGTVHAIDFGCGPGDIAIRVARSCPSWTITGLDASPGMLEVATAAAKQQRTPVHFVLANAKQSELGDDAFDVIFSNSLLHHITDAVSLWREMIRLAKPQATLFLRDLYRPENDSEAARIVATHAGGESALLQEEFHRSLLSAYSPEEIREQLAAVGQQHFTVQIINDRHVDVFGHVKKNS